MNILVKLTYTRVLKQGFGLSNDPDPNIPIAATYDFSEPYYIKGIIKYYIQRDHWQVEEYLRPTPRNKA